MYSIEIHKHRFAAWAAGNAASSRNCRFKVEEAVQIIESIELNKIIQPNQLPNIEQMDIQHKAWCESAIKAADELEIKGFTHGVAAKLINIYLKSIFVCGGFQDDKRVQALHPPIDRVLLSALASNNVNDKKQFWKMRQQQGWSNFDYVSYQSVITQIRDVVKNEPMWTIEQYWQGFQ